MLSSSPFTGRALVVATRHGKEAVIGPVLEAALGVRVVPAPATLDTDALGTFSGEVPRLLDPLAAAREKCARALALTGLDLAVASEGSFGPHPVLGFVAADEEWLVLIDTRNALEISVREISLATNFAAWAVASEAELRAFAEQIGFPAHGLILRPAASAPTDLHKGLTTWPALLTAFQELRRRHDQVWAETDMRAHLNPSRQRVIEAAARTLAQRAATLCPTCATPGFGPTRAIRGLPCGLCGAPTRLVRAHISTCLRCPHEVETQHPNGVASADPGQCDYCNP